MHQHQSCYSSVSSTGALKPGEMLSWKNNPCFIIYKCCICYFGLCTFLQWLLFWIGDMKQKGKRAGGRERKTQLEHLEVVMWPFSFGNKPLWCVTPRTLAIRELHVNIISKSVLCLLSHWTLLFMLFIYQETCTLLCRSMNSVYITVKQLWIPPCLRILHYISWISFCSLQFCHLS